MASQCVCCFGYEGNVLAFDENSWQGVTSAAKKWLEYRRPPQIYKIAEENKSLYKVQFQDLSESIGYHNRCRTNFLNSTKLEAACTRYNKELLLKPVLDDDESCGTDEEEDEFCQPSPVKTRRIAGSHIRMKTGTGVLEHKCIICEKSQPIRFRRGTKLVNQTLTICETKAAGKYN